MLRTTVIIDDDRYWREKLQELLSAERDFEVVAVCSNSREALEAVRRTNPEVVFVEPAMRGIEALPALGERQASGAAKLVMVSRSPRFGLQAFEMRAVDYLVKPFSSERFGRCIARLRALERPRASAEMRAMLDSLPPRSTVKRLILKARGRISFLKVSEILWITAEGNYVRLHTTSGTHLYRDTMLGLLEKLDPERFLRIHRSTIVNKDHVQQIQPWVGGTESVVVMRDGTRLRMSRRYLKRLQNTTRTPAAGSDLNFPRLERLLQEWCV